MFQNIKDILTTFTPGQRLIALLLLLFSLCIISVGPKIINILSHDDTLIQKRLDLQKELIDKQGQEIKKLNDTAERNLHKQHIRERNHYRYVPTAEHIINIFITI